MTEINPNRAQITETVFDPRLEVFDIDFKSKVGSNRCPEINL